MVRAGPYTVRYTKNSALRQSALRLFALGTVISTLFSLLSQLMLRARSFGARVTGVAGKRGLGVRKDWVLSARTLPRHPDQNHVMELITAHTFKPSLRALHI